MSGGVCDAYSGGLGQRLDGPLALSDELQELDPTWATDGLGHLGELLVEAVSGLATLHRHTSIIWMLSSILYSSVE